MREEKDDDEFTREMRKMKNWKMKVLLVN